MKDLGGDVGVSQNFQHCCRHLDVQSKCVIVLFSENLVPSTKLLQQYERSEDLCGNCAMTSSSKKVRDGPLKRPTNWSLELSPL